MATPTAPPPLTPPETEKTEVAVPVKATQDGDTGEEKEASGSFMACCLQQEQDRLGCTANAMCVQRVFTYGRPLDYVLEAIAIIAAIGSGVALAMVNIVLGQFMNVLSGASMALSMDDGPPPNYMEEVSRYS